MLVGARQIRRRRAQVAVLAGVLWGCAGAAEDDTRASASASASAGATASAEAAGDGGSAVKSGGTIGAAGSACELPVTFDIAQYWEAEAIDSGTEKDESASDGDGSADAEKDELAQKIADAFLHQGTVTAACEWSLFAVVMILICLAVLPAAVPMSFIARACSFSAFAV